MSDEKGKWKDILESKYMEINGTNHTRSCYQSWWWRDLVNFCGEGEGVGWFQQALVWNIRSGNSVRFWEDSWIVDNKLKDIYPRLFSLSVNQGMIVGQFGFWDDYGWHWNLNWRRGRFQWESVMEEELLSILSTGVLHRGSKDFITWRGDAKGVFSVKSAYSILVDQRNGSDNDVFKLHWKAKALPKVLITAWRILLDKIPTSKNLISRGVDTNSPLCALCNLSEESTQHLFMDCDVAYRVWMLCFRWIGIGSSKQGHM